MKLFALLFQLYPHTFGTQKNIAFNRKLFTLEIIFVFFLGDCSTLPPTICDDVFDCIMFFSQCSNYEIRKQSLIALGSFCVMNDNYLIRPELKQFYCDILSSDKIEASIKIICMRNIWIYLTESEMNMHNREKECKFLNKIQTYSKWAWFLK